MRQEWPSSFWFAGPRTNIPDTVVRLLVQFLEEGKIGRTVAMVNVADKLGIDSAAAARDGLQQEGFELVYDRSYPLGAKNLGPIMQEVTRSEPDVFLAFSYPDDTVAVVEEARRLNFNPKLFYALVGTAYPSFRDRLGKDAEGIMGVGGWNADLPASREYLRHHTAVVGHEPDRWASPLTFAGLQMLQQAIERVGRIDRAAVVKELQDGTFDTIIGKVQLKDNLLQNGWFVGQWQNGEFYGIAPTGLSGARRPLVPKPAWTPIPRP
jgi:branched-chain amino acid transport system substrate-binding protein